MSEAFIKWNLDILAFLTSLRNPVLDWFFALFTWIGSEYIVIFAVCLLFLCKDKKLAYKIALVFFVSGITVQALKVGCRIDRPWILAEQFPEYLSKYHPLDLFGSIAGATGYSFPSGHTQSAFALFGVLALHAKKPLQKAGLWITAVLIAFSRLYLGVHTPFDVLVSAGLTLLTLLIIQILFEKIDSDRRFDLPVSLTVALISTGVVIFGGILYKNGKIPHDLVADCMKSAACGIGFGIAYMVEKRIIRFNEKEGSLKTKTVRLLVGILTVFALKEGIKYLGIALFHEELLLLDVIRYMLMLFFIMCIYPVLLQKIEKRKQLKSKENK